MAVVGLWCCPGRVRRAAVAGGPRVGRSGPQPKRVEPVEGRDELVGPGPVVGEAQPSPSGGDDDPGGVEQAVAEPFRFGSCQLAVEGEELGPAQEVLGDEHQGEPRLVDRERRRGQVREPGVLGVADALFDPAASAVERFEVRDVAVGQVGDAGPGSGARRCR